MSTDSRRDWTMTIDAAVRQWGPRVNEAALAFEARWTRLALRNHSAKLADGLDVAIAQYDSAMTTGSSIDIANAGQRLVRAFNVLSQMLQSAGVPDDAYMVGKDPQSNLQIIIAWSPAAAAHAQQREELKAAQWLTPDEIATLMALDARAKKVLAVKAVFPGAEMLNVREDTDADD